jgi:flagellar motor switch protein FliN/FliY
MTSRSRSGADTETAVDGAKARDTVAPTARGGSIDTRLLNGVQVSLDAKLGVVTLSVAELMSLKTGSVVNLDSRLNDLVELKLNGAVVARGELVAVEDHFAVRIVEIVPAP